MRLLFCAATFVALCAMTLQPVTAQRPGGRGGPGGFGGRGGPGGGLGGMQPSSDMMILGLLRNEAVMEEVDIMPDQREALQKVAEQVRGGERPDFSRFRDATAEEREKLAEEMREQLAERMNAAKESIQEVLEPAQLKRLNEIVIQLMGSRALSDPKVIEKLGISSEQTKQMEEVRQSSRESMRDLFQGGGREEIRERMAEAREKEEASLMEILTSEQQTKFKELKGEPSEALETMQARGFGAGGQVGGGRPGGFGGQPGRRPEGGFRGRGGDERRGGDRGGARGGRGRGGDGEGRGERQAPVRPQIDA